MTALRLAFLFFSGNEYRHGRDDDVRVRVRAHRGIVNPTSEELALEFAKAENFSRSSKDD